MPSNAVTPALLATNVRSFSKPSSPLLVSSSTSRSQLGTSPLTIFYKGAIVVFDLTSDKAEEIFKLAEKTKRTAVQKIVDEDRLPIARRKSLELFLRRRKQRSAASVPYGGDNR